MARANDPHEEHRRPCPRQTVALHEVVPNRFVDSLLRDPETDCPTTRLEAELAPRYDFPTAPLDELRIYRPCGYGRHLAAVVRVEHDRWGRASLALEVAE